MCSQWENTNCGAEALTIQENVVSFILPNTHKKHSFKPQHYYKKPYQRELKLDCHFTQNTFSKKGLAYVLRQDVKGIPAFRNRMQINDQKKKKKKPEKLVDNLTHGAYHVA